MINYLKLLVSRYTTRRFSFGDSIFLLDLAFNSFTVRACCKNVT